MKLIILGTILSLAINLIAKENIIRNSGFEETYKKGVEVLPKEWRKNFQAYNSHSSHPDQYQ